MQPGILPKYRSQASNVLLHGRSQHLTAALVQSSHAANVTFEKALFDEFGENRLLEQRRAVIGKSLGPGVSLDELFRNDKIAQSQRRIKELGNRARVKNYALIVQTQKRWYRS